MSTRREFVRTAALARPDLLTAGGTPMPNTPRTPPAEVPADRPLRIGALVFPPWTRST